MELRNSGNCGYRIEYVCYFDCENVCFYVYKCI